MISEWFLTVAAGFVEWLSSVFGEWEPPDVLTDTTSVLSGVLSGISGMGVWVDWAVLAACIGAAVLTWGIVVGIKLIRAVIAHVPAFGGAGD